MEDLEKLDAVCRHIELAFQEDREFRPEAVFNSLVLSRDLLWLSTLLYNLLEDTVNKHFESLKKVSKLLDRINNRLSKDRLK